MESAYIARQPILTTEGTTFGYELLFRERDSEDHGDISEGVLATTDVIEETFLMVGIDKLVGHHQACINITHEFIDGHVDLPFPPEQVILELQEETVLDDEILGKIVELSERGFRFAVDQVKPNDPRQKQFSKLPVGTIIKCDAEAFSVDDLRFLISVQSKKEFLYCVYKVETRLVYEAFRRAGCTLFQGFYFQEPELVRHEKLPENQIVLLKIIEKLQDPDVGIKELEALILHDVSISYKILHYINSAAVSLQTHVDSIARAISFLGLNTIKRWVLIMAMSSIKNKPNELTTTALLRSRMCCLLAKHTEVFNPDEASMIGLLSILDALLDMPMSDVLAELPLEESVNKTLLEYSGPMGEILAAIVSYERNNLEYIPFIGVELELIKKYYIDAIEWAESLQEAIQL